MDMPKNKTHRGTAKRVKVSATGKLLRQRAGKRHMLEKKSSRVTRRLAGVVEIAQQDAKRIRKLLGR
jgi:large subunit ribosomal protein L35